MSAIKCRSAALSLYLAVHFHGWDYSATLAELVQICQISPRELADVVALYDEIREPATEDAT